MAAFQVSMHGRFRVSTEDRIEMTEYFDAAANQTDGATTRFEYAENGVDLVRVVDAHGNVTRIQTDDLGRPIRNERLRTIAGSTAQEPVVVHTEYDLNDRVTAVIDPRGRRRETHYDANGRVEERSTVVPQPGSAGPLTRLDEVNEYDAAGRLVAVKNALDQVGRFEYDAVGRPVKTTSPLGHVTRVEYDANGNPVRTIDPTGAETRRRFDAADREVEMIDALGRSTTTSYDREGRVVERVGPGGRILSQVLQFDANGNPTLIEDGKAHQFQLVYDERDRLVEQRGPLGEPGVEAATLYEYDLQGRLLAKTEAAGTAEERTSRLRYDALGRLIETADPLGRRAFFGYDEVGNRVASQNAAGERMTYRYDSGGLLLERAGLGIADTYVYDGFGRQILSKNAEVTRRFEYDDLDRPIAVWDSGFGTARRVYDADGRITQAVYPGDDTSGFPTGAGVTYLHDAIGRVSTIQDPVAGTWQLDYDAIGRLVQRADPGGFSRSLSYTEEGFVERVRLEGPTGVVDDFVYAGHDALGNPGTITSAEGTTALTYDAVSRVKQVDYPGGESEVFDYDLRGNRTSHTTRVGETWSYDYDAADQLLTIADPSAGIVAAFAYDGAGRRTGQIFGAEATQFSYDAAGRLVGVSRSGYQATLGHDPEGLRYRRAETGQPDALFFGEWVERRGGETVRLTHGPGADNVVAEVTLAGDVRTLLRSGTANVTHVAVAGSLEPAPRRYEAFGGVRSGSSVVERGFAGRPPEGATGLINLRARHYDPVTGSFLQVDPLGIEAIQAYAYARQNPYSFWDPSGRDPGQLIFGEGSSIHTSGFDPASSVWDQNRFDISASCPPSCLTGADPGLEALNDFRKEAIASGNGGANFFLEGPLPGASGDLPFYKTGEWRHLSFVQQHDSIIEGAARHAGIDPDLIRTFMYTENVPGRLKDLSLKIPFTPNPRTIQPMNVGVGWAEAFGYQPQDLSIPSYNILVAAELIAGIQRNLRGPASVAEVYSIYKNLRSTGVHQEGLHAETIYRTKPWLR